MEGKPIKNSQKIKKGNQVMITEDYVSFETAKLLKEKGFDARECQNSPRYYYNTDGQFSGPSWDTEYTAPTLQMAMKWLREVHHLYVWISYNFNHTGLPWYYEIFDIKNRKVVKIGGVECGSYEKTCEIAIEECLKNLI